RTKYDDIWFAHSGFGIILKNGETTPQTTSGYDRPLMPRMTCGLDKDRHYMYLVAVDGRMFGWSEGATGTDLVRIMRAAGAYDVIDFDGGGSATLCYWDDEKKAPQTVNRHDRVPNGYYRPCGMNMGIYIKHDN
ncbi:MAG: phosphodiester glycosidase family protein, partial [Victivallales bacterium]|nr:phosphodiester glycosidase family protein [Victivallales bacterium]